MECLDTANCLKNEEFMLRNTYLNSIAWAESRKEKTPTSVKPKKKKQLQWLDKGKNERAKLEILNEDQDLINKDKVKPVTAHIGVEAKDVKSAMKNSGSAKTK